ncbi:MAG: C-GCAxxG-C-C family protein, partial [Mailhella sp.]
LLVCAGLPCPASLLKTASGFGRGMGGAGCACGALTGGIMAIGIFFGRENDTGMPPDICAELSKKWHDTFKSMNKATCCRVLHHGLAYGTPEQFDSCCHRTAEAAEAAAKLILEASNRHS